MFSKPLPRNALLAVLTEQIKNKHFGGFELNLLLNEKYLRTARHSS